MPMALSSPAVDDQTKLSPENLHTKKQCTVTGDPWQLHQHAHRAPSRSQTGGRQSKANPHGGGNRRRKMSSIWSSAQKRTVPCMSLPLWAIVAVGRHRCHRSRDGKVEELGGDAQGKDPPPTHLPETPRRRPLGPPWGPRQATGRWTPTTGSRAASRQVTGANGGRILLGRAEGRR
jgi:hypothetical protein